MKILVYCISFIISCSVFGLDFYVPDGDFSCEIEFTEKSGFIHYVDEDFPREIVTLDKPLLKKETVIFNFQSNEMTVKNPQVLPGFMLLRVGNYYLQKLSNFTGPNYSEFQVYWSSWYFGSSLTFKVFEIIDLETITADLRLSDNDGRYYNFEKIVCKKL